MSDYCYDSQFSDVCGLLSEILQELRELRQNIEPLLEPKLILPTPRTVYEDESKNDN